MAKKEGVLAKLRRELAELQQSHTELRTLEAITQKKYLEEKELREALEERLDEVQGDLRKDESAHKGARNLIQSLERDVASEKAVSRALTELLRHALNRR